MYLNEHLIAAKKQNISMKNIVLLFILVVGLNSCDNKSGKVKKEHLNGMDFPNFQEKHSGLVNILQKKDTLTITVEFSDCGEWGGHKEQINLFRNSENELIARIQIDSISCENIRVYGDYSDLDDNTRQVVKTIEKKLDSDDEELFNLFIHRILELKLNYRFSIIMEDNEEIIPMFIDAGTSIEIRNSNSTFLIVYYNIAETANTWYGKIRKQIFGLKIKRKTATNNTYTAFRN